MADQANLSSGAKFSFLMNRASKNIEKAVREIKSRQ
jgi:hypothetical protein